MLLLKESVLSFDRKKQRNIGFPTYQSALNLFRLNPLNIIFVGFSI